MAVTWPDGGLPGPPRSRSHFIRRSPGAAFSLGRPSLPVMRPATSRVHRAIWFFIPFQYIITPPGRCQGRGWIFAPGPPGGNYGTMFPVWAWQGGDAPVPRLRPGMEGRWGWEHGQTGEKRAEKRARNRPGPGVSGRFRFFSGTCQEGGSLVQWNELIDSIRQNSTQAEAIPRRGGGKSA